MRSAKPFEILSDVGTTEVFEQLPSLYRRLGKVVRWKSAHQERARLQRPKCNVVLCGGIRNLNRKSQFLTKKDGRTIPFTRKQALKHHIAGRKK